MRRVQEFEVMSDDVGKRADVFVSEQFPEFTRSALKGLFDKGLVLVEDIKIGPGDKLKEVQVLKVDAASLYAEPELVKLPIIYEGDDVVVIDKPAGVLTHAKGAINTESTVATFLKSKITDKTLMGNRAGIVHRLDRGTSGVIIGAKNSAALAKLQKQFSQRKTKKEYVAIVEGEVEPKEAIIDAPIGRNPKKPQTFKVMSSGKPAQTYYKVEKVIKKKGKPYSLLTLKPVTGRTHQLRVHLAYIEHPIVGDHVYGRENGGRLMLHAASLELTLPSRERKIFTSAIPNDIQEF